MNPQPLQVIITLMPDNRISVTGPLENKIMMLGLLELAKGIVLNFQPEPDESVKPAPRGFADALRSGG